MGSQPRRVTIVDVAQHAQVSTTAVSKVLRNAYGTSPTMRAKVQKAIADLGYRPYAAARGLRGQTYTIGVLLPDLRNPFFPEILDGLTESLRDTDYQVLLGPSYCNGEQAEAKVTEAMIDRGTIRWVFAAGSLAMALKKGIGELDEKPVSLGVAEDPSHASKPYFIPKDRVEQAKGMVRDGRAKGIEFVVPIDSVIEDGSVVDEDRASAIRVIRGYRQSGDETCRGDGVYLYEGTRFTGTAAGGAARDPAKRRRCAFGVRPAL